MRRRFRQQFRSGVAEAALIEDEEVEPTEVRCDQGELLAQRSLRQAQRGADREPVSLDVEEHERAMVATTSEIEASDTSGSKAGAQQAWCFCWVSCGRPQSVVSKKYSAYQGFAGNSTFFVLGGFALAILLLSGPVARTLALDLRGFLMNAHLVPSDGAGLTTVSRGALMAWAAAVAMPLGALMLAGLAGGAIQHRPLWSGEPLRPQLSRLSPLSGAKRFLAAKPSSSF